MTREDSLEIGIADVERALRRDIGSADPERASAIAGLVRLAEAREAGLRREYARLSRVLSPDHPRLEALTLRLEASAALREEAAFEVLRGEAGVPEPDKEAWTLYGFVRGVEPKALEDRGVALFDRRGSLIEGAEAPIEKDGAFRLRYRAPETEGSAAKKGSAPEEVFISVVDARRRAVHKDPRALGPEKGRISYMEIDVDRTTARPSPGAGTARPETGRTRRPPATKAAGAPRTGGKRGPAVEATEQAPSSTPRGRRTPSGRRTQTPPEGVANDARQGPRR